MSIDYAFVSDMLARYTKHLFDVERACRNNLSSYETQLTELDRLAEKYPERYMKRLEEISERKSNTQVTLDMTVEKINKMADQIAELNKLVA